jgi:Mg/Co/Ni transporter MgtE
MNEYTRRLAGLLVSRPAVVVQNRLMSAADRDVALSMLYMSDADRGRILEKVSPAKQRRIVEELELHEHLQITYPQYEAAITSVIDALEGDSVQTKVKSYIRPRRATRRRA